MLRRRWSSRWFGCMLWLLSPIGLGAEADGLAGAIDSRHRGICWVGGRSPVTAAQFEMLRSKRIEWISQTPFGWQRAIDEPRLDTNVERSAQGHGILWGESDEGIRRTTALAKSHGIKTLLKPHIWLTPQSGQWRGLIAMQNATDWQIWFANYERFILHYAELAEAEGIEALSIGTELHETVRQRSSDWRQLIGKIRRVYSGQLTYSANFNREFAEVPFWDLLDFIGIQAYFPLASAAEPSIGELLQGWLPHVKAIEAVQRRYQKPVVFTEVGYRSVRHTAREPWVWPDRYDIDSTTVSNEAQARAFEAMFQMFWRRPWFAGTYVWKWYPTVNGHEYYSSNAQSPSISAFHSIDFTPQGKPAEQVISDWYAR